MLPICMVNAETMAQIPEDVSLYLRALRRRISELEQTAPQQRIAKLEAVNRGLQVQLEEALALVAQQQEQLGLLQQQLADTTAKLNTNSSLAIADTNACLSPLTRFAQSSLAYPLPVAVAASP